MKLSFVIPCYGSENTIEFVINEIIDVVSQKKDIFDYEVVCVNDSSPDGVLEVLKKLALSNDRIKVIDLAKNFGKHSAVMAGLASASGDYIVNLDDDGQCPMDKLWDLIEPLKQENVDMAMAEYPQKKQSAFKNFGSYVNSLMSIILINKPKDLQFSNFFVIKSFVAKEILSYSNPYPYLEGLILRTTNRIESVPMEERERCSGQGNFTLKKSLSLLINGFTAFSVKPLRIATFLGLFFALIGFVFGFVIIIRKLINTSIPMGYSSTLAIMLFIGGMIMLMLGLIGEYIGRIYISINDSPQYVIRKKYNFDKGEKNEDN